MIKTLGKLIVAGVCIFALLQTIGPGIPTRPAVAELDAPPEIRHILEKDCYSCHSDQRRLSWFDQIVPSYWLVRHDILTAREHLNFSTIGSKPAAAQKATLYEAVSMIQLGAMPLPQFVQLHPEAQVTADELLALKTYLAPWTPEAAGSSKAEPVLTAFVSPASAPIELTAVCPEFNGVQFDPAFESWKPISTTDRGDNNTFRLILGNDIAVNALRSGSISPWPDGTRFAKIAWQQAPGPDGLLHPGNFVQVELMVKDAQKYRDTDGWGWGRWRGLDLKPYGQGAESVKECTGCYLPVRGDDSVYTLPITAAQSAGKEIVNNRAAALPANLPYQPLGWRAITLFVDPKTRAMATLYGNDTAMTAVEARGPVSGTAPGYLAGLVLRSSPGRNATTRTGLEHAFRTRRYRWNFYAPQPRGNCRLSA